MRIDSATRDQLQAWEKELSAQYQRICQHELSLDITRGKPSAEQLQLSDRLDGILNGDYRAADGTDTRNYGGLEGLLCARELGADILQVPTAEVVAAGNSSLTLMYHAVLTGYLFGFAGNVPWRDLQAPKFLCPVPGYDRHFAICEQLGIGMVNVPMTDSGPDMDAVEEQIRQDQDIIGLWCVPKFSNPTGVTYNKETVDRLAQLAQFANPGFRIFWDNAYAIHDLEQQVNLPSIRAATLENDTADSVLQFASTSKVTHAGAGVAFISASSANLASLKKQMQAMTIGPDKVNQLRHSRFFAEFTMLREHMQKHAQILKPKFECVLSQLHNAFGDADLGTWETPKGGYFVSFNTRPGCATAVVKLAADAGVKLTPAGATFPYGKDPEDCNIRIAPSFPPLEELDTAMAVFILCVKLASVRQQLALP
ncbi:DNA-binding transcriptional regulator, MocR family, contains an aminotransferase domain [Microbulbifer donghaiensis]|uniref:DNA-binding transcriptional regulator, MocR family, contains an aminotransferase domain n=1 Tax=Microbulbifer donghaiensis TaxID=494016 RepID=A0A1M4Y8Q9_9GAMM|nr:aminotransferase class I/II-fold pyridoxal phosphate-dependent enzyme [Microbulbifer donghaiensis]SHF01993.1 DNA-binding transcriptional regulator, MocR family, contains an aminotransferase domain [Microbulbifer donghaiensis]